MKQRIGMLGFFVFIFFLFFHPINASDFYHHLVTGRIIWETRSLPYTDTLSFTAAGLPWVAHSWGMGFLYYLLYRFIHPEAIAFFTAAIGVATAFFLYKTLRKLDTAPLYSYILTGLVCTVLSLRWPTRPEILAPLFMSIILFFTADAPRLHRILIPIFFLWGILYGSSAFLGIAVLIWYLTIRSQEKKHDGIVILGCLMASLLNGYGLASFLYIFQIPAIAPHTGEWLPMLITLNPALPELVLYYQHQVIGYTLFVAIWLIAIGTAIIKTGGKMNIFFIGISFAMLAPFQSIRFLNLAPVLAAPAIVIGLSHWKKRPQQALYVALIALAAYITVVRALTFGTGSGEGFQKKPMAFLRAQNISGNIFSIQEIGALIAWELPASKIFVDTRDDLYQPTGLFTRLQHMDEGKLTILDLTDQYHADIIIGDIANGIAYKPLLYSPDWSLVYLTDGFFVSVRSEVAQKHNLMTFNSVDPFRMPPVKPGELTEGIRELGELRKLDPDSQENTVRLAESLYAQKDFAKAYELTQSLSPPSLFTIRSNIETIAWGELVGKYALAAGDCAVARRLLTAADKASYGKLLFSPTIRLPTTVDRYLGSYYAQCEGNTALARRYFEQFLSSAANPLERRAVEQEMSSLK